jgi:hypothetical protein
MSEEELAKTEEVKEIWFGLKQYGEWMRTVTGKVFRFSAREAHEMLIDDRIPRSWWACREFQRYEE